MEKAESSILKLVYFLKCVVVLLIGIGILLIIFSFPPPYNPDDIEDIGDGLKTIFSGVSFLLLANGLSKKEKWAFYICLFLFGLNIFATVLYLFLHFSFQKLDSLFATIRLGIFGYFFYLLVNGREIFMAQPKEKISSWFRKPAFITVIIIFIFMNLFPYIILIIKEYYRPKISTETLEFLLEGVDIPEKIKEELMESSGK